MIQKIRPNIRSILLGNLPSYAYVLLISAIVWLGSTAYSQRMTSSGFEPALLRADPKLGTSLPKMFGDSGQQPIVLVFLPACSCDKDTLLSLLTQIGTSLEPRIVIARDPKKLNALSREFPRIRIFGEPHLDRVPELNVCFLPRAYAFSNKGLLVWKQESPDLPMSVAIAEAKRITEVNGHNLE
jgi:hypothetical protein